MFLSECDVKKLAGNKELLGIHLVWISLDFACPALPLRKKKRKKLP